MVITAHHLNDAVETWVWSSMHGKGKIIEPIQAITYNKRGYTLMRPFLLTKKSDFEEYAQNNNLVAVDDPCNKNMKLMRNYMREHMMPHIKVINPGIEKVIIKKYLELKKG